MFMQSTLEKWRSFCSYFKSDHDQLSHDKIYIILCLGCILFAGITQYLVRDNQWEHWKNNPDIYFHDDTPMVMAKDAPYFLSLADNYRDGINSFEILRNYPDNTPEFRARHSDPNDEPYDPPSQLSWQDIPMLSLILAFLSDHVTDGNTTLAGNLMIPITAFLTAIAIGVMFWIVGYPIEGAIASVGFGLSPIIMGRTAIGRIDTDQLIFFFLAMTLSFILLTARQNTNGRVLIFTLLAGLSSQLFQFWYKQDLFLILLPGLLFIGLVLHRHHFKTAIGLSLAMIILSGPITFFSGLLPTITRSLEILGLVSVNISDVVSVSLSYPDTFSTIEELQVQPLDISLIGMAIWPAFAIAGIIGFSLWTITHLKKGIVFLPFFLLGLSGLFTGVRFTIYAVPFIWFGAAWLGILFIRIGLKQIAKKQVHRNHGMAIGAIALLSMASLAVYVQPKVYEYKPDFTPEIVGLFKELKTYHQAKLEPSDLVPVVLTAWDYGYLSTYITEMATLHDGGSQRSPKTYFIARGLVDNRPDQLLKIIDFISHEGVPGIFAASTDIPTLKAKIDNSPPSDRPSYLVLTGEMQGLIPGIAKNGFHDIKSNTPLDDRLLIRFMPTNPVCQQINISQLTCNDALVDLSKGTIDDAPVLKQITQIQNGKVLKTQTLNQDGQIVFVINKTLDGVSVHFVDMLLWNSVYYQLMERADFDSSHLKLVIDHYPHGRVYEIIK